MGRVPTLEKAMRIEAVIDAPQVLNNGLAIYNVPDGVITGDGFEAKIVDPSGDWSRAISPNVMALDVRVSALLEDGSYLYITYPGRVVINDQVAGKMASGETIEGSEMYFTTTPSIETNSPELQWMNDALFVGAMQSNTMATPEKQGHLVYDVYKIV